MAERVTRAEAEPQALKQTPCGLCRVLRGSPCGDAGADGGTRTRDLFLTKEVLYLLSYISVSMILTVCDDLRLPAFLPPDGFTKEVLYLLSYISISMILTVCGDLRLPAFLPPAGVTKEVLYLLSYISVCLVGGCLTALPLRGAAAGAAERGDAFASDAIDYMSFGGLCQ